MRSPDSIWFLDFNGDFAFDPATEIVHWGSRFDVPIVADWNGDGRDSVGVYSRGRWFIDIDDNRLFDQPVEQKGWGTEGWTPIPGKWQ